jgi:hypothetical protein
MSPRTAKNSNTSESKRGDSKRIADRFGDWREGERDEEQGRENRPRLSPTSCPGRRIASLLRRPISVEETGRGGSEEREERREKVVQTEGSSGALDLGAAGDQRMKQEKKEV